MDLEILDQLICEATVDLVQLSSDAVRALPLPSPMFRQDAQLEVPHVKEAFRQGKAHEHKSMYSQWKSPLNHILHSETGA